MADRGLLRRARLDLPRPEGRHVRRSCHRQFLSGAPHHHGRGRLRADRQAAAARRWSNRSATGAATAGASRARTIPAASASTGNWANCPHGYDHKYIYSHIGYNLKTTDMQAAVGVAQIEKAARIYRSATNGISLALREGLRDLKELFILPEATPDRTRVGSDSRWWSAKRRRFRATKLLEYLEERRSQTRLLFGGNLVRQPAYQECPAPSRGSLKNSDLVMNQVFWIGVYPGLTREMLDYVWNALQSSKSLARRIAERCRMETSSAEATWAKSGLGKKPGGRRASLLTSSPRLASTITAISISPSA